MEAEKVARTAMLRKLMYYSTLGGTPGSIGKLSYTERLPRPGIFGGERALTIYLDVLGRKFVADVWVICTPIPPILFGAWSFTLPPSAAPARIILCRFGHEGRILNHLCILVWGTNRQHFSRGSLLSGHYRSSVLVEGNQEVSGQRPQ